MAYTPFKMKGPSLYNSPTKQLKPSFMSEEDIHRQNINVHGQPEKGSVKESEWIKEGRLTEEGKKKPWVPGPAKQVKGPEETEVIKGIKSSKLEDEGQQIIGRVDRGEITQEEGNRLLSLHQDKAIAAESE